MKSPELVWMADVDAQDCMFAGFALNQIESNTAFKLLPIIIFKTSAEKKDSEPTSRGGAEKFFTKPARMDEWTEIMNSPAQVY